MPTTVLNSVHSRTTASEATRWGQLIFGIICMVMIANLQYGWTLFVNPIDQKYHWGRAAIQVAFTIFVPRARRSRKKEAGSPCGPTRQKVQ